MESHSRWYNDLPEERFWLEITDRQDIGVDLWGPQRSEAGEPHAAYALMEDVRPGDVVFHYSTRTKGIEAWSRVTSAPFPDVVLWETHAGIRDMRVPAHARPGWRIGLEGPFPVEPNVTLASIRSFAQSLRDVRDKIRASGKGAPYFPFEISDKREVRPTQIYLSKLPSAVVYLFPALVRAAAYAQATTEGNSQSLKPGQPFGQTYRELGPSKIEHAMEPFDVDPDVIDRGRQGHWDTQQELVHRLRAIGLEPLSPKPDGPQYDVAWISTAHRSVAEVKSITPTNEEKQLRLGLGQVLRYRHQMETGNHVQTVPVLAIETEPTSGSWIDLCASLGVTLVWRGHMEAIA